MSLKVKLIPQKSSTVMTDYKPKVDEVFRRFFYPQSSTETELLQEKEPNLVSRISSYLGGGVSIYDLKSNKVMKAFSNDKKNFKKILRHLEYQTCKISDGVKLHSVLIRAPSRASAGANFHPTAVNKSSHSWCFGKGFLSEEQLLWDHTGVSSGLPPQNHNLMVPCQSHTKVPYNQGLKNQEECLLSE